MLMTGDQIRKSLKSLTSFATALITAASLFPSFALPMSSPSEKTAPETTREQLEDPSQDSGDDSDVPEQSNKGAVLHEDGTVEFLAMDLDEEPSEAPPGSSTQEPSPSRQTDRRPATAPVPGLKKPPQKATPTNDSQMPSEEDSPTPQETSPETEEDKPQEEGGYLNGSAFSPFGSNIDGTKPNPMDGPAISGLNAPSRNRSSLAPTQVPRK